MKTRLKLAISVAIFLAGLGLLSRFFDWMNRPSDAWLYAGAFGSLSLAVLVPGLIAIVWRIDALRHKRP